MSSAHRRSGTSHRAMGLWAGTGVRGEGAGLGKEDILHKVTRTGLWGAEPLRQLGPLRSRMLPK